MAEWKKECVQGPLKDKLPRSPKEKHSFIKTKAE